MSSPAPSMMDSLTLNIAQEIHVRASLDATFVALLEQLGPYNEVGEGKPMPMNVEPWPGGRWFRDLLAEKICSDCLGGGKVEPDLRG